MKACEYEFEAPQQPPSRLRILLERPPGSSTATWTLLENHRCPHCPLPTEAGACCPAAADIEPIVETLGNVASIAALKVTVTTTQRVYQQTVTGSEAARAALGLVMATSACPILDDMHILARFHLPFATQDESTFRLVSAYLMRHFFTQQGTPDLESLIAKMEDLKKLNIAFANRLRAACSKDAIPNAIVQLFTLSLAVAGDAEDGFGNLKEFFRTAETPAPTEKGGPARDDLNH